MVGNLSGKILVPIAVPVGSVSKGSRLGRIETVAPEISDIQAEVRPADRVAQAEDRVGNFQVAATLERYEFVRVVRGISANQ